MGNKITPIDCTITRDKDGCVVYIKSEIIEAEAKKYSGGMDNPTTYYISKRGGSSGFLFDVGPGDIGGDEIYQALRTVGLKDGLTIKIKRPMSPEATAQIGKNLGEMVKVHVRNFLSAFRVSVRVEVDENSISWTPMGSAPTTLPTR